MVFNDLDDASRSVPERCGVAAPALDGGGSSRNGLAPLESCKRLVLFEIKTGMKRMFDSPLGLSGRSYQHSLWAELHLDCSCHLVQCETVCYFA